jgi:hypothetical protein
MHVTDGQFIPYNELVTVPPGVGVTCTLNVPSVLPPGQVDTVGLSTVTVAYATTTFDAPPVPTGTLAEIFPTPQGGSVSGGEFSGGADGVNKPGAVIVTTPLSIFQVA